MPVPAPIALLSDLVARGRDGEAEVQARVSAHLSALGCTVEALDYDPGAVPLREEFASAGTLQPGLRTAVLGRLRGSAGGRSIILFAHPDNEPHGDLSGWSMDPFRAVARDGRLHGFGIADDLSGVAAMISGLAEALSGGWRPGGDVILASTPSKRHARGVAAVLGHIAAPDAALYLHPAESGAGLAEVKACTPGLLEFQIAFEGRAPLTAEPGQTAFAHRAISATSVLAAISLALAELDEARAGRLRHARLEDFVGRATNIHLSHASVGQSGQRNRIAVTGRVEGAASLPPGERLASAQREIEEAIAALWRKPPFDCLPQPDITWLAGVAGAETPADHPLFRCVDEAIAGAFGRPAFVNPVHTASDIRVPILQAGIPTVGLGPLGGNLTQNGLVDEWVDAADHERCVGVVARILQRWSI